MAAVATARRPTGREKLDGLFFNDEEWEVLERTAVEEDLAAVGFRYHAKSTQKRQDAHLAMYVSFTRRRNNLPADMPEVEVLPLAFPADIDLLITQFRQFIVIMFKILQPRSKTSEHVSYRTLMSYRASLQFWTPRFFDQFGQVPPSSYKLFSKMSEVMRSVFNRLGVKDRRQHKIMVTVGLPELLQLVDYETFRNKCVEVSEQHVFAWVLARFTACRPGSIGPPRHFDSRHGGIGAIICRDITLTRGQELGMIDLSVDFVYIKTTSPDPEFQSKNANPATIRVHLKSPPAEYISLSPGHRVLVMMLRHNKLKHFKTIDEVMDSDSQYIEIKDECLDDPLLYKAGPRGLSLDKTGPATSESLTEYIQRRGRNLGFGTDITFYALRKGTANELIKSVGSERTREIMSHAPDSRNMERFYLDTRQTLDLVGLGTNSATLAGGVSGQMVKESSTIAIHALIHDNERLRHTQGKALNSMVNKLMADDPNFPITANETELRNYTRRVRRIAFAQLLKQQQAEQKALMTRVDFDKRVEAVNSASAFHTAIMTEARKTLAGPAQNDPRITGAAAGTHDFDQDFEEGDADPHARDLEDDVANETAPSEGYVMRLDEAGDSDPQHEDTIPYIVTAKTFMNAILHNTLAETKQWKDRSATDRLCTECVDDDTVAEVQKMKQWTSAAHLDRHLQSTFHSIYEQWCRYEKKKGPQYDGKFWCKYCAELDGENDEDRQTFKAVADVVKHILASTPAMELTDKRPDGHDDLKAADGWYLDEFYGTISAGAEKQRVDKARKRLSDIGTALDPLLEPGSTVHVPKSTRDGIVYGEGPASFNTRDGIVYGEIQPRTTRDGIVFSAPRKLIREADGTPYWRDEDGTEHAAREGVVLGSEADGTEPAAGRGGTRAGTTRKRAVLAGKEDEEEEEEEEEEEYEDDDDEDEDDINMEEDDDDE